MSATSAKYRVVVTQADERDAPLASRLAAMGAEIVSVPAIGIEPPLDPGPLQAALEQLEQYRWVLFTSRHAVEVLAKHGSLPLPDGVKAAAAGPATARALAAVGVTPALVADPPGAEALASLLLSRDTAIDSAMILWPRSTLASTALASRLRDAGAIVDDPPAYQTRPAKSAAAADNPVVASMVEGLHRRILDGGIDAACFMSPSAARGLAGLMGAADLSILRGKILVASIGPSTTRALAALGASPDVESKDRTATGLAHAVMTSLAARRPPQQEKTR